MIILINGAPRSGKDTVAELINSSLTNKGNVCLMKFASPLTSLLTAIMGSQFGPLLMDHKSSHIQPDQLREHLKDAKILRNGATPRQLLIGLSENLMKPLFGDDVFGYIAAEDVKQKIQPDNNNFFVFSDSGFRREAEALLEGLKYTNQKALIIQVRRDGKTFDGDSRSYVAIDGIPLIVLENNGSLDDLAENVYNILYDYVIPVESNPNADLTSDVVDKLSRSFICRNLVSGNGELFSC